MRIPTFTIAALLFYSGILPGQPRWDGGGDGTRWQDQLNWTEDRLPLPTEFVFFDGLTAQITGAPVTVGGIRLEHGARIILDLDATIEIPPQQSDAISLGSGCQLELGKDGEGRKFTLQGSGTERGLACYRGSESAHLILAQGSDLYTRDLLTVLFQEDSSATFVNRGAIFMDSSIRDGLYARGTVENYGQIRATRLGNDVITLDGSANFTNDITGDIMALEMGDDGIELRQSATFINNGTLSLTSSEEAASSNSCLNVGQEGGAATFLNNSDQVIVNGGGGQESRPIFIYSKGLFINLGRISVSGGSEGNSFFLEGTARVDTNAILELNQGRITVAPSGRLTNDGLLRSAFAEGGVRSDGFALNRGFYAYATDTVFATGAGQNEDLGLALPGNPGGPAPVLGADGSCSVNIVSAPYRFFADGSLVGQTDRDGNLFFREGSVDSLPVVLTTSLPGIQIEVVDLCPAAFGAPNATASFVTRSLTIFPTLLGRGQSVSLDVADLPGQRLRVDIFDLSGRSYARASMIGGGTRSLPLPGLPPGMYVLHLTGGGEQRVARFQVR